MSKSLRDLQALRGAACLAVVLHHLGTLEAESAWPGRVLRPFAAAGFAGVDVFFVLSGFIICYANYHRLGRRSELRPYLLDRLWRVYPTYWVCFLGIAVLFHWALSQSYYPGYFRHALFHALLVPRPTANFAVPQAWTLSFEVMFYVLFGVLFLLPRRYAGPILAGWFLAAVGWSVVVRPADPMVGMPLSPYTLEFLLGVLAATALAKRGPARGVAALAAGLGWAVIAAAVVNSDGSHLANDPLMRLACFGGPAALMVYGLAARETAGRTTLPSFLRPVGDASYSIYLTHLAVLWAFQRNGYFAGEPTMVGQAALLALPTAASCAVGWFVHRFVERPLLNWRKRSKAGRQTAPPPPVPAVRLAA